MPMDLIKKSVSFLLLSHNTVGKQERPIRSLVLVTALPLQGEFICMGEQFLLAFKISWILKGKDQSCHIFFLQSIIAISNNKPHAKQRLVVNTIFQVVIILIKDHNDLALATEL